jgi:hypothetical protein
MSSLQLTWVTCCLVRFVTRMRHQQALGLDYGVEVQADQAAHLQEAVRHHIYSMRLVSVADVPVIVFTTSDGFSVCCDSTEHMLPPIVHGVCPVLYNWPVLSAFWTVIKGKTGHLPHQQPRVQSCGMTRANP